MSDLFEEDDDNTGSEVVDDFVDIDEDLDVDPEVEGTDSRDLDARRRLEKMLDEKRLRDELDDFGDY